MPRVEAYGLSRVSQNPRPDGSITAVPSPESFGSGFGETLQRIGGSLADDLITKQRNDADQLAALNARNQLNEGVTSLLKDPQTGALNVTGQAAFGLVDAVTPKFEDLVGGITKGLANDRQRLAFQQTVVQARNRVHEDLASHVSQQMSVVDQQETAKGLENARNDAIGNATNPTRIGVALQQTEAMVADHVKRAGLGPEAAQAMLDEARTEFHAGVIKQLLDTNQDRFAQTYFEGTQEQIAGETRGQIAKALEEGSLRGESQRTADDIIAGRAGATGQSPDYGYGRRWNEATQSYSGSPKGLGFFGPLTTKSGQVMSELSIDEEIDGKNVSMPTLVPTLTKAQVETLLALKDGQAIPDEIRAKAVAYAKQRIAAGKSPFAGPGEQSNTFADLKRAPTPQVQPAQPPTLSEARDQVKAITDPKLRDEVQSRVEHDFAVQNAIQREAEEQAMVAAGNIIDANPAKGVRAIPTSTWSTFSPSQKASLEAYAKRNAPGEAGVKTDWATYYSLMRIASDPAQRDQFAETNLLNYRAKLGNTEFKQLVEAQVAVRKKDDAGVDRLLVSEKMQDQAINDALTSIGVDPTPASPGANAYDKTVSDRVLTFRRSVRDALLAHEQQTGKKATVPEVQDIVDTLIARTAKGKTHWFSADEPDQLAFESTGAVTAIADVPASERTLITQALRRAGRPVTDAAVLALFNAHLQDVRGRK